MTYLSNRMAYIDAILFLEQHNETILQVIKDMPNLTKKVIIRDLSNSSKDNTSVKTWHVIFNIVNNVARNLRCIKC